MTLWPTLRPQDTPLRNLFYLNTPLFQGDIFRVVRYPLIFQIFVSQCILISYTFKRLLNIFVDSVYLKHLMKKEVAII